MTLNFIPLALLTPFRLGAVRLSRGSLPRSACIAVLKLAARNRRVAAALTEIRPLDRPDLSFESTDSMVMDAVFWYGVQGYEGIMAEVWRRLCATSSSTLEVGANVGLFSVIGGRASTGAYTVVEPLPEVARLLRANLARNGLARVEVIEGAAIPTDRPERVRLNVPSEGRNAPVGAHLVTGSEVLERSSEHIVEVAGIPFQSLLAGRTLIKIDAEGIEYELLAAARPHLLTERPTLVIEVLPESDRLAHFLADLAASAGYTINVIPAYGSDRIVTVPPSDFKASIPAAHHSKDVVLTAHGPL